MKISINKLQQFPRILFTITLFSILAACGGSSSSTPAAPPVDPTDATLKSLSLSIGALSPTFSSNVIAYTFTTTASTTTVTPTATQATATVKVNGATVNLGSSSEPIALAVGQTINIVVTAIDKITTKTYTITRLSTDASLSGLELTGGTLKPDFASNVMEYTLTTNAISTDVTAAVKQAKASIKINNADATSISLTVGSENTITIIVTAEDGETKKTYSITVTRIDTATDARLSALVVSAGALSPAFAEDVTEYTVTTTTTDTTNSAGTTTVTPTVKQSAATVKINGSASGEITLTAGGATPIAVVVTSANGNNTKTYNITVNHVADLELINPNANATDAANQKFGQKVVQLSNGNIIVHAPGYGTDKGAVHFYKPTSDTAVASFYGMNAGDHLGSGGIIALANDNFLIVSPFEDKGEFDAAGSVTWVNGSTGEKGETIRGDSANDTLGSGGVHLLDDNTIIINSPNYKSNGIATGAVMLLTNSGDSIKTTLYGNDNTDGFTTTKLGDKGITLLGNGKFVIVSTEHTNGTFTNAGLVQLVNNEGKVLKSLTGQGLKADEKFGGDGITPLKDGNFLIATQTHDAGSLTNAGSIHLINGADGKQIGETLIGNKKDGYLGKTSGSGKTSAGNAATTTITPLGNNNYVVLHHTADNGNITNAGSIRLFNGVSGTATGTPVFGSYAHDFVKEDFYMTKITALKNHNFVVTAPHSDKQDVQLVGSIRLMDGTSGAQLSLQEGGRRGDFLGNGDTIELSNGKYVVASFGYSYNNKSGNGLVRVFTGQGDTFKSLEGNTESELLGGGGLTALGNNKFVIASTYSVLVSIQNERYFLSRYTIQLVDASGDNTKNIMEISGDDKSYFLGFGGVTRLNNHNFVFALPEDDVTVNGAETENAGSVQAVNGTTGAEGNKIVGTKAGDMNSVQMIRPTTTGDYFILSQPLADDNDKIDVGRVRLVVPAF